MRCCCAGRINANSPESHTNRIDGPIVAIRRRYVAAIRVRDDAIDQVGLYVEPDIERTSTGRDDGNDIRNGSPSLRLPRAVIVAGSVSRHHPSRAMYALET